METWWDQLNPAIFDRCLKPTYEGWKQYLCQGNHQGVQGLKPTYEGWRHHYNLWVVNVSDRLKPTYEGWKPQNQPGHDVDSVEFEAYL